jgi:hypothetical protein
MDYCLKKVKSIRTELNNKIEQYEIVKREIELKPKLFEKIKNIGDNHKLLELGKSFKEIKYHNLFSSLDNRYSNLGEHYFDFLGSRYIHSTFITGGKEFFVCIHTKRDYDCGYCIMSTDCTNGDFFNCGCWDNSMAKEIIDVFNQNSGPENKITCDDFLKLMDIILEVYYEGFTVISIE